MSQNVCALRCCAVALTRICRGLGSICLDLNERLLGHKRYTMQNAYPHRSSVNPVSQRGRAAFSRAASAWIVNYYTLDIAVKLLIKGPAIRGSLIMAP